MNKRGIGGIIYFFVILFIILMLGFIAVIAVSVIDFASDTLTPELNTIGVVGTTNLSKVSSYAFGVGNTFIQNLPWLVALSYVAALVFSIVFAISMSYNPHPVFIGFYFLLIILLIFGSIVLSNMYENIYQQDNILSERLNDQPLLSHMILFAPVIFTVIAFVAGIYMFSRIGEGGLTWKL